MPGFSFSNRTWRCTSCCNRRGLRFCHLCARSTRTRTPNSVEPFSLDRRTTRTLSPRFSMPAATKTPRREFLQLADTYDAEKHDIAGFYISEKLDGTRCFWDGGISRGEPTASVPWANIIDP